VTLRPFFKPTGVVLVGATNDPTKLGYGIAENLLGFPGTVHLVGRSTGTILGRLVYARLAEVPDPVELAVLLVPAAVVPETLAACGRRGIRAVVISSGGFRETGAEGAALEAACVDVARRHGIRFLGPNCIGTIDTHVPLDTTFLRQAGTVTGSIAFLSHSGALCAAVIDWSKGQGFGFSRLVSLGNQADLTETDLLAAVAADDATRVVTMYLEGIGEGTRFVEMARTIEKPIVVHKAGRFTTGRRAAASHTGALAGNEGAFDAAFRRTGVLRASSTKQMFDWARALAWAPPMRGPNVAVITNAGGPGVAAADAIEGHGLVMAALGETTTARLHELLPGAASIQNPVDMLASATPEQYARCLDLVLSDDRVDAAMVILPPPPRYPAESVAEALVTVDRGKPVVVALMGDPAIRVAAERLRAAHIPDYRFPSEAADALGAVYRYHAKSPAEPCPASRLTGFEIPKDGWLDQVSALALVRSAGIPGVPTVRVTDVAGALEAAEHLGYPVALKVDTPNLLHKTQAGGVALDLGTRNDVEAAFRSIVRSTGAAASVVQSMVTGDEEVVVGVVRDEQFGPLLMCGSGGVDVEQMRDVAFALAPITCSDIEYLLSHTMVGGRLSAAGARLVSDVLVGVGTLAVEHPEIAELEINPLVVRRDGVVAIDVRVRIDRTGVAGGG
jgi:acetyl coenzyme A synthetase (ADP forming)-like protein